MLNNKKEFKINYGGKDVVVETGRLAKQADGAVLVSCNGTQVLVTVCSSRDMKDGQDFFPLTVDYYEKFYSAGKFLGGFMKRETKPTTQETLTARLIDRPLRPCFPEGYMYETQVVATVLSYNETGDPEVLAALGASAAVAISDIPFASTLGNCKVARIDGKFVLNPSHSEWANSDMEIAVAGSEEAILMVEGESKEAPEAEVLEAIMWGHEQIKSYCKLVNQMQKEVGKKKRVFTPAHPNEVLMQKIEKAFTSDARNVLNILDKSDRSLATRDLIAKVKTELAKNFTEFNLPADEQFGKKAFQCVDALLYKMMRNDILEHSKRIGGRKLDEVRKIETETNILNAPHGSALFTRGETQVLSTVTLGGSKGDQMSDRISGLFYNKFYLHYNFPGFSVGEAKGKYNVGRRELGHGNLAERALKAVMPSQEDFSYTVRVSCEVLESNGSSSMGSVCAGSMALMDAGVPLNSPVAGIAMGLISDGGKFKILSDILGDEDHLGDMDFKVAGTTKGITAIQMDIKIVGITREIIKDALTQAQKGRLHILGEMSKTITNQRNEFKEGVPRIEMMKIAQDKIGALIGPGGKNIKAIQENFAVTIEVEEDGTLRVLGVDPLKLKECVNLINLQINGPEINSEYDGIVVSIKEYGAFVDIAPGLSGLVHVSEMSDERVVDVNDYVIEGDVIKVKVIEIDRMGRIKLSARASVPLRKKGK